ncbi:pyridoxal-phosphate dependent enzyme [Dyella sp. SG609]|uniref:threonine ammonia-lyase n=1 Tax=Dyella sp. SG609 TaxID=2587018 RepID=UPI001446B766|nr:pyridoxal-phosphate dependent enzyme [Dyella sp. SG609]NKJ23383.1 threonine dehydratase [Dyella sp. SG609]
MNTTLDLDGIVAAPSSIDPVFLRTPVRRSPALDAALGCRLIAKDETGNPIGSFKGRGTEWFAATALHPGEAIVSASAGNFGQGLARAATRRGHACTVFAAATANPAKLDAMRALGADVRLAGADFDAAKAAARHYAQEQGLRFVEDGAEPAIAQGAGTIATELLADAAPEVVLVPLGNGALLEGIGSVLRARLPSAEIVAVVAAGAPSMKLSLEAERAIETARADTIADGIAVRVPIASRLPQLRRCCDRIVAVDEAQLMSAMRLLHRHLHLVVEPAGAAGVAAILAEPARYAGRLAATVLCGRNIHPSLREKLLAD